MAISKKRIAYLLDVYSANKATPEEELELFEWAAKGGELPVKSHIKKLLSEYNAGEPDPTVDWEQLYQRIAQQKSQRDFVSVKRRISWQPWAAAAVVVLMLGTGYHLFNSENTRKRPVVLSEIRNADIPPPKTVHAFLTLGDGKKIILGNVAAGTVATQGNVNVVKTKKGELVYEGRNSCVEFNTLHNPNGSPVVHLLLGDGSKVWLNAGSSLTFPTSFTGSERRVVMTGEAYFEVAPAADMPFIVTKGETNVKVLGTHFNVEAFDDEPLLKVTLLEGRVSVSNKEPGNATIINAGQQANVSGNGSISLAKSVNTVEVMAWKNGMFSYSGTDIEAIMRQVARWYNVDVKIEGTINEQFYAEVARNTSISTLLKMLEATNMVTFRIEEKKIVVKAASK